MKLVRKEKDEFVFDIGKREKRLLLEVLKLYPLIPTAHQGVNQTAGPTRTAENQRLLEESLAERKRENKRQLLGLLNDEKRFKETDLGCDFTLSGEGRRVWRVGRDRWRFARPAPRARLPKRHLSLDRRSDHLVVARSARHF